MTTIHIIDDHGQISLGADHAGNAVHIDVIEPGVWRVALTGDIPDGERWLHEPEAQAKLDAALAWAADHPPGDTLADIEAAMASRSDSADR